MNGRPSAARAGNSSWTLKSLDEVKTKQIFISSHSLITLHTQVEMRGALERANAISMGEEPISMLIRLGTAVRRLPSLSPCVAVRVAARLEVPGIKLCILRCMPQRGSVSWGERELMSARRGGIADNPHDESLGAEITGAHGGASCYQWSPTVTSRAKEQLWCHTRSSRHLHLLGYRLVAWLMN